ncbi:hypothetical protein AG0111_0g1752 [Alternaria gaisen]|uniref:Uncharacterized protein n=1 Tax=Alternaria gaisen TaxID=167740 RepID=A0ACB6FZ93_9PLEO|nr:hypothetical protein AG0111_0g1752 [Alternaria gaisen]
MCRDPYFLIILRFTDLKDVGLKMEWGTWIMEYPKDYRGDLDAWIAYWNADEWNGKFRKVMITIPTDCDRDEVAVVAAKFGKVEVLAQKLVGNAGNAIWGPFVLYFMEEDGNKNYKRSIVVDRKH